MEDTQHVTPVCAFWNFSLTWVSVINIVVFYYVIFHVANLLKNRSVWAPMIHCIYLMTPYGTYQKNLLNWPSVSGLFVSTWCLFFYRHNHTYKWSSDGCRVTSAGSGVTSCLCNHTTNFAVLMNYLEPKVQKTNAVVLLFIVYIGIKPHSNWNES